MFKNNSNFILYLSCFALACLFSCKSGTVNLFKPASPHEAYKRKLVNAGLDKTSMGTAWINAADQILGEVAEIKIPFKEQGFFAAESIPVVTYKFNATRGQKLKFTLVKNPPEQFMIYLDVWHRREDGKNKLIASADSLSTPLELEIDETGTYLLRLQPELLKSGSYNLEITSGPSLGYPISGTRRNHIQSFFGDGRDAGTRKHEGIDLFAPFRTPVVAIAEGTVVRVNENNLGGKVVWMRPRGKDYTLYYAHLDEQVAVDGQEVKPGDTLGLMGNTGNARTTPPHLHFGIYTSGGAVDPLPFVNPVVKSAPKITASTDQLNATLRSVHSAKIHSAPDIKANVIYTASSGTVMLANAAMGNWYRIELPDGKIGFVESRLLTNTATPLKKVSLKRTQRKLYSKADSLSPVKLNLTAGEPVNVLGSFDRYQLVLTKGLTTGWIQNL